MSMSCCRLLLLLHLKAPSKILVIHHLAGGQREQCRLCALHSDHPSLQHGHPHRPVHQGQAVEVTSSEVRCRVKEIIWHKLFIGKRFFALPVPFYLPHRKWMQPFSILYLSNKARTALLTEPRVLFTTALVDRQRTRRHEKNLEEKSSTVGKYKSIRPKLI